MKAIAPTDLRASGELSALMRQHDWSTSPLGDPRAWPQALRTIVSMLLNSKFPMFVAWGPELIFLYNDAYAQILGTKHPAALGRRFRDVWDEIWPDISPMVDKALAGEAVFLEDLPLTMLRNGYAEQTWFTFSYSPLLDEHGKIAGMYCACTETTGHRLAERRRAFQLHLADCLRGVSDPQEVMRAATRLLGEHLGVARVMYGEIDTAQNSISFHSGYTDGSMPPLAGPYALDGFGPRGIARLRGRHTIASGDVANDRRINDPMVIATFSALGSRAVIAVPLVRKDAFRALLTVGHPLPRTWTEEDIALVEDVAERTWDALERARAEAQLRELNETLGERVEARTAELERAHEQLHQSQKMEAVGQLTGGLAHDFNNLLAGIMGSLELMQARAAQGRTQDLGRYIGAAMTSANRAAALTHRLLAFSRRQTLDPKSTNVNQLVNSMADLIQRTVGPAVHVETVLGGGLRRTLCDPNQLENALLNLAINARDAMPDGGRLTIETVNTRLDDAYAALHPEVVPGQYVAVSVSDTGSGMTPDIVDRAFDPFFTTKPIGEGTGLGLSMIYGFIRQSGGHIRIYSEPGHGTTIRLHLPRHTGPDVDDPQSPARAQAPQAKAGETVLVVDDEPVVRMLVSEVLTELGYAALEAADGAEAMRVLRSAQRVDLLITDVGLPGGMNGRQMADAARQLRPGMKVLFITGYAENAVVGNGLLDTGMQVMTKPFAMDALAARIRSMIEAGTAKRPQAGPESD